MNANDILVRRMTAFRSWNDMAASLKTGYVPTIRRNPGSTFV